ncbi:hypothetical protein ABL78_4424 [Leptomonas seymouri]|uniref:Uncharacterized protein n=1 Tax=Leptomonas seymouri TaxID=5684 RepID=A0A0N1PD18_LEPSE|nr:hypothetical protein ABL78_4424 [Leptomonas seymouri]|eukprot:KPI86522.1 hypothetical protein ABL78_4424 [Leptomonas seymouri]
MPANNNDLIFLKRAAVFGSGIASGMCMELDVWAGPFTRGVLEFVVLSEALGGYDASPLHADCGGLV